MRLSVVYSFDTPPSANRFLNDVNSNPTLEYAKASLFDGDKVKITYLIQSLSYDETLSILDDLSAHYGGREVQP